MATFTVTLKVKTTAATHSLYWARKDAVDKGSYVDFEADDDVLVGKLEEQSPGQFVYVLVLGGGQHDSSWELSIQKGSKTPLKRKGALDKNGDGGRVAELAIG